MNFPKSILVLLALSACDSAKEFPNIAPDLSERSFIDVRGRIAISTDGRDIPSPVKDLTFAVADLPPTFVVHRKRYVPQFEIRQKSHASWSGRADALYVLAKTTAYQPVATKRVDQLEEAGLDPSRLSRQRDLRSAIAQSPSRSEFFAPPISKVVVAENRTQGDELATPGTQVLLAENATDWIEPVKKKTGTAKLPLVITPDKISSGL